MSNKSKNLTPVERWTLLDKELRRFTPHLSAWLGRIEDFRELRVKSRDDGTCLAIAKGFGPDGGLVVAFGVGYGYSACLLALDATIQGGHWRIDKPWQPGNK